MNQGVVDRFFGPTAAYPYAVDYDLFVQYNESKGYSETRVYRNGAWQVKPVNLVQDYVNKIANGVDSTSVRSGAVTSLERMRLEVPAMGGFGPHIETGLIQANRMVAVIMTGNIRYAVKTTNGSGFNSLNVHVMTQGGVQLSKQTYPLGMLTANKEYTNIETSFTVYLNNDNIGMAGGIYMIRFSVSDNLPNRAVNMSTTNLSIPVDMQVFKA